MKKIFVASLVRNGIIGGSLIVDDESVTFRTNKLTVPEKFRNLRLGFTGIKTYVASLTTTEISLKNGDSYRFIVFGNSKFCSLLDSKGVIGHTK